MPDALEALADQTGALMVVPFELAEFRVANSVVGRYTLPDALDRLLEDTGLSGGLFEKRVITITLLEEEAMPVKKKGLVATILTSALFTGSGGAALAQDEGAESLILEEIVVTAQKREQNAQDVGIAISVFDDRALVHAGIQDVSRLDLVTPGMSFAQRGNDFKITMRGANAENTFRDVSPPVGMFLDGVYKPRASQAGAAFLDVAASGSTERPARYVIREEYARRSDQRNHQQTEPGGIRLRCRYHGRKLCPFQAGRLSEYTAIR